MPWLTPRRRDLGELLSGYGLILVVIWTPNPVQRPLYWFTFFWVLAVSLLKREDWRSYGLGVRGLVASLWVVALAVALAAGAMATARHYGTLHPLFGRASRGWHAWSYSVWALLQQFIMQGYMLLRLLRLLGSRRMAVVAAALMFTAAHLPNPVLVALTLVWGFASCLLFLRYRNLYTLGIAHAIFGLTVAITVPNSVQHHMRVGLGYWHYHAAPKTLAGAGPGMVPPPRPG